jgi:hypothetical protein
MNTAEWGWPRWRHRTASTQRETSLKRYRRDWKINLIEAENPNWDDLFPQLFVETGPLANLQPREEPM